MDSIISNEDNKTVIVASFEEQANSRMTESDGTLSWEATDEFVVFDGNGEKVTFTTNENDASIGKFTADKNVTLDEGSYAVYYPIDNALSINNKTLTVTLANSYGSTSLAKAPMWGILDDGNVSFKHLGAILKFTYGDIPQGYTTLVVEASKPICGSFTADLTDEEPVLSFAENNVSDDNKKVEVSILTGDGVFYVPLPVGTYDLKVYAKNNSNTVALKSWTNLTIARKGLYRTSANYVAVDADTPASVSTAISNIENNSVVDLTGTIDATADDAGEMTLPDVDATYNFATAPTTTQDKPLIINETDGSNGSKVKLGMPTGTTLYARVETPNSTISLENGNYEKFESTTAENTLIVGKGVTINSLVIN